MSNEDLFSKQSTFHSCGVLQCEIITSDSMATVERVKLHMAKKYDLTNCVWDLCNRGICA